MLNFLKKLSKTNKDKDPDNYIMYYVEDGDLKIKFSFDRIEDFVNLADSVVNCKLREASIETIKKQLIINGFDAEAMLVNYITSSYIKPSEFKI